jgi:hypothetical protein
MLTKKGIGKRVAAKRRQRIIEINAQLTHCADGHLLSPDNTVLVGPEQFRVCKLCRSRKATAAKAAKRRSA